MTNKILHELIFKVAYSLKRPGVIPYYDNFQETQWQSIEWLRGQQKKQLRELINFAYENLP